MRVTAPSLLGLLLLIPSPAPAQELPELRATYEMYAAGFHVAEVEATFAIGPRRYDVQLAYHTTGVVGFFHRGHQTSVVMGTWRGDLPQPEEYSGTGVWDGVNRTTDILYRDGVPSVQRLEPPQDQEREPVPLALQQNTVDTLSALALLIRRVQDTGRCDTAVHTYDGRRASEISARTVGEEILPLADGSSYTGRALHCDFTGQMLAGFRHDDGPSERRPLHGSAWLAPVQPHAPPLPVRMTFETRWFGDANMYLTDLKDVAPREVAAH